MLCLEHRIYNTEEGEIERREDTRVKFSTYWEIFPCFDLWPLFGILHNWLDV
jgi:hypothetical protein